MAKATVTINGVVHKVKKSHAKQYRDSGTGPVADLVAPAAAQHASALKASAPGDPLPVPPVVSISIPKKDRTLRVPTMADMPGAKEALDIVSPVLKAWGIDIKIK